jgi:hypothetical protein
MSVFCVLATPASERMLRFRKLALFFSTHLLRYENLFTKYVLFFPPRTCCTSTFGSAFQRPPILCWQGRATAALRRDAAGDRPRAYAARRDQRGVAAQCAIQRRGSADDEVERPPVGGRQGAVMCTTARLTFTGWDLRARRSSACHFPYSGGCTRALSPRSVQEG